MLLLSHHTIYHNVEIITSPDFLYHAITSAEGLEKWWTLHSSGIPAKGEEYNFYFSPEYDWKAKVTKCEANKLIEWTITEADEDWKDTILSFVIVEKNNKCLLRFEHQKWREADDHFRQTSYCWAMYLKCLKDFLESSVVLPYLKRSGLSNY
jgi:uncharacterized protein YndB with AHSA1/START domain